MSEVETEPLLTRREEWAPTTRLAVNDPDQPQDTNDGINNTFQIDPIDPAPLTPAHTHSTTP